VKQPNKNCPINWTEFYIYFLRGVEGKHYINVRLLRLRLAMTKSRGSLREVTCKVYDRKLYKMKATKQSCHCEAPKVTKQSLIGIVDYATQKIFLKQSASPWGSASPRGSIKNHIYTNILRS
jgi:hypothetical protein